MNSKWSRMVSQNEFVNYFDKPETDLILEACNEFSGFENLVSYNESVQLDIGRACSIKYLFEHPTTSELNSINYISTLLQLINDYKCVCIDTYEEHEPDEDYDLYNLWYNKAHQCTQLLVSLASL